MVKSIQATVSDELAERLTEVKDEHRWTWDEFMEKTAELYENTDYEEVLDE